MTGTINAVPKDKKGTFVLRGKYKQRESQKRGDHKCSDKFAPDGRMTPAHLWSFDSKEVALAHAEEWRDFVNKRCIYAEGSEEPVKKKARLESAT